MITESQGRGYRDKSNSPQYENTLYECHTAGRGSDRVEFGSLHRHRAGDKVVLTDEFLNSLSLACHLRLEQASLGYGNPGSGNVAVFAHRPFPPPLGRVAFRATLGTAATFP